jgi:hypothetical protein
MKFIRGQAKKFNKSIMLVGFLSLPHGFKLLEGNIHDHDAFPTNELVRSVPHGMPIITNFPLDPRPLWNTLIEL